MARQFQLRGDTLAHWLEADPVLADREMVLIATNPYQPTDYDQYKVGNGIKRFSELTYKGLPAVQQRGHSLTDIMSQYAVTREIEQLEATQQQTAQLIQDLQNHYGQLGDPGTGNWHKQNSDTGTDSTSFQIHRVRLENCHAGLELRNETDTDYQDLTLRDLYVKGELHAGKLTQTEIEQIKAKQNTIVLNDGETGAGITKGMAGIEIDRGTLPRIFLIFDETDQTIKAGTTDNMAALALIAGVLQNGAGLIWDDQQKTFVPTQYLRREQIKILTELPGDDESGEDGDIIIIPSDSEIGTWDEFVEQFLNAIIKPIVHITPSSYRKQNDPAFLDGTIRLKLTAGKTVGENLTILYELPGGWQELTIPKNLDTAETTLPPEAAGKTIALKQKNIVGDDLYIYTLDKTIQIIS